ncbi:MAG: Crp/Fnr family transcriptional regulator [Saprospiraceae bacterium]
MISIDLKRDNHAAIIPMVFNQESCSDLFVKMPEEELKRGDVIYRERQAVKHVYLVVKGMVKVFSVHQDKEMLEDYFQAGELLNCPIIFDVQAQGHTAVAITSGVVVKKLPLGLFKQAIQSNTTLYREVLLNINASLQRAQARLHRMTLLSAHERVLHFLAQYAKKSGRRVGYEYVIKPVLTHQEIGNIAGVGRQTVTTVLNELRRDGIIHFTRRYLIVRDLDALQALCS